MAKNLVISIMELRFIGLASLILCSVASGCYDEERRALLSFKSHLTDPSNRLVTWQGYNCCNWHGISCSGRSLHVVSVDIRNPNPDSVMFDYNNNKEISSANSASGAINGTFSSALFALAHLEYLDLSFNNFMFSKIPLGIGKLAKLTYLNLSNAVLSGPIATEFANLTSLRQLDLSCSSAVTDLSTLSTDLTSKISSQAGSLYRYVDNGNLSSSNLDWLRGLRKLRKLQLNGVDLSEVTLSKEWAEPISSYSKLRELKLSNCGISGKIPVNHLLNLTQLSLLLLHMDFNHLGGIPMTLGNLTQLSNLDLTNSNVVGSVPYLPKMEILKVGENSGVIVDLHSMFAVAWPKLENLDIHSTRVIGSIPDSIGNVTSLIQVTAYSCSINGSIPSSLTNLSRLETLLLDFNNIVGRLPSSMASLRCLKTLKLTDNCLEGFIPDSICEISSLTYITLQGNSFTGSLPDCIGQLSNLQVFVVNSNKLIGKIPSLPLLFRNSTPLMIGLGDNSLTVDVLNQGQFPTKFQPVMLDLSSCHLQGSIPRFISNLTQLSFLRLSQNNLSGTIPPWLFDLPSLGYLDLSFNNLHGVLPSNITLRPYFGTTGLRLAGNRFEGTIPFFSKNVAVVDISENDFTGRIPSEMGLGSISYLALAENKLSGEIPESLFRENNVLQLLNLSHNILMGTVPTSLGNCASLVVLSLGGNNLRGIVPNELGNAKNLSYLDLTQNQFDGVFPSFTQKLWNLTVLKLGNNKFHGKIPPFIGNLKNLRVLVLESNYFNGTVPQEINLLEKLQFIDLSNNSLTGPIPEKLDGLNLLKTRPKDGNIIGYIIDGLYVGVELNIMIKGESYSLEVVRTYHNGLDLSFNNLTGKIPSQIGLLEGLSMLNLSHNHLSGEIPASIGKMSGLESMDLSFNVLRGHIPLSLNLLDYLSVVNFSYNNFSGKIPTGTRFDTWYGEDGSAYTGNKYLCDVPGGMDCNNNSTSNQEETSEDDSKQTILLCLVVTIGYGVGLWGHFGAVYFLNEEWRTRYWRFIDKIAETLGKRMPRRRR